MKTATGLTTTGIGLSALSGVDSTNTVGKFSKALPTVANLAVYSAINKKLYKLQK